LGDKLAQQLIVVVHVPSVAIADAIPETNVQMFPKILYVEGQSAFQLYLKKRYAIMRLHDEVGSVPIVAQWNGQAAEVS
jgi:hypothetical protein